MIDTYGRTYYQKAIVDPLLPIFSFISPTMITFCGIVAGISILPLLSIKYTLLAFVMLLFSGFLDTLDGSMARFKNQTTPFGAALDIIGDRMVEFSVIVGLYLYQPEIRSLNCLLMLGSILLCITSFLIVGIFTQNNTEKSFHYSPGIIERGEAFIFFSIMILFPSTFSIVSTIFISLVLITTLIRLWQFKQSYNSYTEERSNFGFLALRKPRD
ncbi:MAG: CDP-alcohol phosphatidyltransferase family protein [Parachlamydiaceae bacterium]|nr:CDP-alcohol phosphatidyltransferase family protein [Parachlamydiaceae bacterium]